MYLQKCIYKLITLCDNESYQQTKGAFMLNMKDVRILVLKAKIETLDINSLSQETIKELLTVLGISHDDIVWIFDDLKNKMIEEQMKTIISNRTK
jgi:hypothetical protein